MDIEVRLLRSFVATYELGSLSRAAEKLACTQAAMSMRLKMLEGEVGGELFLRRHHGLEPTSRGSELYAKALTVLAAYDELLSTSRSRAPLYRIRIGVPDDYALGLLSAVLRDFKRELADVELEIVCDLSANLYAALHRQDLDIALATLAARPPSTRLAIEARLNWIHRADFRRPDSGGVALAAYPEGCVFRRAMIGALEKARQPWRVAVQSRSQAGIVPAVRAGVAITRWSLAPRRRAWRKPLRPIGCRRSIQFPSI
jgi:DNA-binding transcriptional LysR family regulator